jgi:integrase
MPSMKREKTKYVGVYPVMGTEIITGKLERSFYIMYRRDGRLIEEKAGRQYQDNMTAAKASQMRAERIKGKAPSNKARRETKEAEKAAEKSKWTLSRLWDEYKQVRSPKSIVSDDNHFENYIGPDFGKKELKDIDPLSVDRLKSKLLKIRKPQTVAHVIEIIRRLSNFAVKKGLCPGLNFKVSLPEFNNEKTADLTPDQLRGLLKMIDEDDHLQCGKMLLLALYIFHGLRHVFASGLASSGRVDLYNLQKLLRHRSPEMV